MAEGSAEFDDAVRLFYGTLQELRGRIRVIRVGGAMGGSKWGWGSQWGLGGSWWGWGSVNGVGGLQVGSGGN